MIAPAFQYDFYLKSMLCIINALIHHIISHFSNNMLQHNVLNFMQCTNIEFTLSICSF